MKEQLLDAWRINNRMNLLMINNITDEGMQKTLSTRGGRTVYLQLVHVQNVRMNWLEITAKDIFQKNEILGKEASYNKKKLISSFENTEKAIEELIERSWNGDGKLKGFKKGIIPFIGYLISHESHHRGNILLTLKQTGEKIPDTLKWGLWDWSK